MRTTRRFSAAVIALVAMVFAGVAQAQVLDQVPADALVVIKVNNLQKTSGKIGAFVKQIGMAQMMQAAAGNADPLVAIQEQMNIKQGFDLAGDMAIVILNPDRVVVALPEGEDGDAPGGDEPAIVILLPVTDYKLFLGNFADAKTEGDITTVNIEGEETLVANWGKFAALTPAKTSALLAKKPAGLKLQGVASRQMNAGCAGIYVNMPAIRKVALPELQKGRAEMIKEMEKELAKNPKFAPLAKVAVNQFMDMVEGFLQTADSVVKSIDIKPEGISSTVVVEFTPNSYMAKQLANVKGTDGALLTGLPSQKYLVYGGGVTSPVVGTMLNDFLDPIVKELKAIGPEMKPALDYVDAFRKAQAAQKASVFGLVAPTDAMGQGSLIQLIGIYEGDAVALKGAMKNMAEAQTGLMKVLMADQPNVQADMIATKYTSNARQVGGVQFDELASDINMPGNDKDAMQMKQILAMVYGPAGQKAYLGVVDNNHLLTTMGLNEKTMADAVAAVKGGKDVLGTTAVLKAVDAQLPKTRCAVIYLPVDQWITTGLNYAKQMGAPNMNLQLPPDMKPVGLAVGTEGSAMRLDAFIPSDLVQALIAAGMQMQQMMMIPGGDVEPAVLEPDPQ